MASEHNTDLLLKQREAELALINSVQQGLLAKKDMKEIYELIGEKLRDLFDAQVTGIYTFDLDAGQEHFQYLFEDGERLYPESRRLNQIRMWLIKNADVLLVNENADETIEKITGDKHVAVPGTRLPKSLLFVPLIVDNHVTGCLSLQNLDREHAFSESDVQLLNTLVSSISIALENARLFSETEQRNAELAVINSVQQGLVAEMDMQGIYDLVGEKIRILFDAQVVIIATLNREDGVENFQYFFENGERVYPETRQFDKIRERLISTRKLILIEEDSAQAVATITGKAARAVPGTKWPKSLLFVPLKVGDTVPGYVSLQNLDREYAFSSSDVRMLSTLANSMSVALENARLFNETEQRNAELAVINSVQQGLVAEMEMQGIYELVGNRVRELFDAQVVGINTIDIENNMEFFHYFYEDGGRIYPAARQLDKVRQRLVETKKLIFINDDLINRMEKITGTPIKAIPGTVMPKSVLFVPMVVGDTVRGYVSLQNLDREHAFSDSDVALLGTLVNSMSVALENARLFNETTRLLAITEQRATEMQTVNRISQALVSQLEFDALIKLVGELMTETFKADIVYVALYDEKSNMIHFPFEYGDKNEPRMFGDGFTERIITSNEPLLINKDVAEIRAQLKARQIGRVMSSFLGVPVQIGKKPIGVISVQSTEEENRFNENDMRLLSTIAASVSVAMQNADAYQKMRSALNDLKAAQEQLVQQEKLASLGQLTAGIAHEIKNPLNFVNNFSDVSLEMIDEALEEIRQIGGNDHASETAAILTDIKANLKKIHVHGTRADSIVKSMLQHSRGGGGNLEPTDVNGTLKEFVNLAYHGMRASTKPISVDIRFELDDQAGDVPLIPEDFSRVILNLCNNAFDAMRDKQVALSDEGSQPGSKDNRPRPESGSDSNRHGPESGRSGNRPSPESGGEPYQPELTIRTLRNNSTVTIEFKDNGPGIPDDIKDKILQPFFTTKKGTDGTGLGLSITNDIIKAHGGTLDIESEVGNYSTFKIHLA